MSDAAFMELYRLSAVGFEHLLKKLDESGIVLHIRTMDVVPDLEAGMPDNQIMEKYKLSEEALK